MAKKGLNTSKGLGALIAADMDFIADDAASDGRVTELKLIDIEPNTNQPRKKFDDESLIELSESIKEHGVISPILVYKSQNGYYKIIAGERRWRASKIAGVKTIPAIIKDYDEMQIYEVALIENLQRENLNPVEEAMGYKKLMEDFSLTQEQIAKKLSKSRSGIANTLRLLNLSKEVLKLLEEGQISIGHGKVLASLSDKGRQLEMAKAIIEKQLSVRQLEELLKKGAEKPRKKININLKLAFENLEKHIGDIFSTKVTIVDKKGKGKITIDYYSKEDLERITKLLENITK